MRDRRTLESVTDGLVSKSLRERAEMIESYITAFLLYTNLRIDEVELIEYRSGDAIAWRLQEINDSKDTCAVCKRALHETSRVPEFNEALESDYNSSYWPSSTLQIKSKSEDKPRPTIRAAECDPNLEPLFSKSAYFDADTTEE